jgi:hypothetical protein
VGEGRQRVGRETQMERVRGGREGGRAGEREGGIDGWMEGGREGGMDGGREGGMDRGREEEPQGCRRTTASRTHTDTARGLPRSQPDSCTGTPDPLYICMYKDSNLDTMGGRRGVYKVFKDPP